MNIKLPANVFYDKGSKALAFFGKQVTTILIHWTGKMLQNWFCHLINGLICSTQPAVDRGVPSFGLDRVNQQELLNTMTSLIQEMQVY